MWHPGKHWQLNRRILRMTVAVMALSGMARAQFAQFAKGADISWLPQMEALGYKFYDVDGVEKDCLDILKGRQLTSISLRVWVNPSSSPQNGHCSVKETASMALRCQKKGLRVMVGPHYGDSWNSVGTQTAPAAWRSMSYADMKLALAAHVTNLMTTLRDSGVTPEWFKNGNEVNKGICGATGAVSNPTQMVGLFNAGYDAAKAVFPSVKVIIHVGSPESAGAQNMLDAFSQNGGKWDILGLSSYATLANNSRDLNSAKTLQARFNKPVMMVEIGGDATKPNDVKTIITNWITGMDALGPSKGQGVFYWEPEGYSPFTNYNMTAWNATTKQPTLAMEGFLTPITVSIPPGDVLPDRENRFQVHANPFDAGFVNLELDGAEGPSRLRLFDARGTLVHAQRVDGPRALLRLDLPSGAFVAEMVNGKKAFTREFTVP